jgi:2-polyprenyl-6-methoxyphenol hydroxylase-like FAD-dependent oxidoreductase
MNNCANISVLIVGAGPTGLALACVLARRGVTFRIIDKTAEYFAGSRGKGLQPRSLEVLEDLGIIDRILANGRFHLPFRGYDGATVLGDHDMHADRVPTPDVPYASPLIVPQWRVEEILRERLAEFGGRVELATELIGFEQNIDCVTATLSRTDGTEQLVAGYLVGADGGHSLVRKALGVGFEGETWKDERMLVGDVQVDGLDREHWHSWPKHAGGWVALCPLPSTNSFQFQAQIAADEPDEPTLRRFQEIIDERSGQPGIRLHDATWLSLYRANVRMVDRYRIGRVFLAGDAAHVHSPAGGQGMNTGIQDAYNLGWKLGEVLAGAPGELLDTYEEERLPVAASLLGITTKLHRAAFTGKLSDHRRGPETLQLGINYRGSSLARDERDSPALVQAGDRAPDAPCHDSAGKPIRLFDLFRGPHFTLLAFCPGEVTQAITQCLGSSVHAYIVIRAEQPAGNAAPGAGIVDTIADTAGHAYRAYDVEAGALVLIRPDGYLGLVTGCKSAGSVEEYLNRVCAGAVSGR